MNCRTAGAASRRLSSSAEAGEIKPTCGSLRVVDGPIRFGAARLGAAATDLRQRLFEDVRAHAEARRDLQQHSPTDPSVALARRSIDDAEKATRQHLVEVETHLQRLG